MIFIGIDPGKAGAIAAIDTRNTILLLEDYPGDEYACARLVKDFMSVVATSAKAAIERAQSMPQQGVRSMFTYGDNFGVWKGVMCMAEIPYMLPTPQQWQKGVISKAKDKKPALAAAQRLFPTADLVGPRGGAKDGRADALLIADWCRRQFVAEQPRRRRR